MTKRIISLFMSVLILMSSLSCISFVAEASSFKETMQNRGFPSSYVDDLYELHKKHPNWDFRVFKTDLNWSSAVAGERSKHGQQLVEKPAPNTGYYCDCSDCTNSDGSFRIREGKSWVAASDACVKYYMDPRNWLDEKSVFMFESTAYDSSQNVDGIESILAKGWMHDKYITYMNSKGSLVTFKDSNGNKVKYSEAILKAAKYSGMSAYYLASKMVQEVGMGPKNTATGTIGTVKGYEGIYNFYSIGANTGAMDGLRWASVSGNSTNCVCYVRAQATTSSTALVKVSAGTSVNILYTTDKQKDGYKWHKVEVKYSGKTYNGYIRSDLVSQASYNRPWTNPYKSIYYGASWIANGYSKYQYTGYLQKYNVNKESNSLYNHEYGANVAAAVSEAVRSYDAYNSVGLLENKKIFYIPVFKSMPSTASPQPASKTSVKNVKLTSRKGESLSLSWDKYTNATKYEVYVSNQTKGTNFYKIVTTNSATLDGLTMGNSYSIKVKAYVKSWLDYSSVLNCKTLPEKVTNLVATPKKATVVNLEWNRVTPCDGYVVYLYKDGKYERVKAVSGSSNISTTVTGLTGGSINQFRVAAYVDNKKVGSKSNVSTAYTRPCQVTGVKLSSTSSKIKVTWSRVSGYASGYYVQFAKDSSFKNVIATKKVEMQSSLTYTGKNFTKGKTYYVRVRAYKIQNHTDKYYGLWSSAKKIVAK